METDNLAYLEETAQEAAEEYRDPIAEGGRNYLWDMAREIADGMPPERLKNLLACAVSEPSLAGAIPDHLTLHDGDGRMVEKIISANLWEYLATVAHERLLEIREEIEESEGGGYRRRPFGEEGS